MIRHAVAWGRGLSGDRMKQAIGIIGGSFDPIHVGHLILAQDAAEAFALDRVLFVPCAQAPHKPAGPVAPAADRAAMIGLAVAGDPRFELCRLELDRGGVSYTYDTVSALRAAYPDAALRFVIGADTLTELHSWRRIGDLLELCEFVTIARPGFRLLDLKPGDLRLPGALAGELLRRVAVGHAVDVSSSDIRMRLARGVGVRYLVPDSVNTYISEHHLYGI